MTCCAPFRRADGSMTSAAPSGWRVGSGGGGATLSPTPPNQLTEVSALFFVFSSMTSLQKEEFFDLVATAQGRRLEDQRAQLGRSSPPKTKTRNDLYDMILTTQAQGRLEDQRSRAPGPMDDEDFFSLLLRVQGGRMDEQRTELPRLLQT
uniref:G protein signaling modulator 3 n=1 Tax=Oreochromis aureus TaxID=47969 RepID=A0A668SFV2_OREAU